MKLLNIGSLNIDKVYQVDEFVKPSETKSAQKLETYAGGKGLNQSIALARAGSDVWHAGMIGKEGAFLKETLKQSGVNTDYIVVKDSDTGHAIIQVDKTGQNSILLFAGTNYEIDQSYIDRVLDRAEVGDFLVLQNEISNVPYIIEKGYLKGMRIVLNPSPIGEQISLIDLNKVEWLVLNEIEGNALTGKSEPNQITHALIEAFPNLKVVLTLGEDGVIYADSIQHFRHPKYDVQVVDTTAAGDTFMGYFISCIARGEGIEKSLEFASKAAALCVTKQGASVAIPTKEEVQSFRV